MKKINPEWIMYADADERITEKNIVVKLKEMSEEVESEQTDENIDEEDDENETSENVDSSEI